VVLSVFARNPFPFFFFKTISLSLWFRWSEYIIFRFFTKFELNF
jgi:hypothetical protein